MRCRQARYVLPDTSREIVAAVTVGGLLAGPSAARTYGLWAGLDARLHISVGSNSSRLRTTSFRSSTPELVIHWLKDGATPELGPECWRVSFATCVRQVVEWCDAETGLACVETAMTSRRLGAQLIAAIFASQPSRSRAIARRARPGCDSGAESIVGQRLGQRGVALRRQVVIAGVGRVDMVVVGTRLVIEVDGRLYHQDPSAFQEDRRRDAELAARGYAVVRLSYAKVMFDWPWCERVVHEALRSA